MQLATIYSYAVVGVKAQPIQIEVHIANGLPGLAIVGLPEATVRESKDRVRSAIVNSGFDYPARRITVNLAPADLPKFGSGFDLPIAIGILYASEQISVENIDCYAFIGELSLSGQIRAVTGVLPIAVRSQQDGKQLIIPEMNQNEVAILDGKDYRCAESLPQTCAHLTAMQPLSIIANQKIEKPIPYPLCLSDVKAQPQAKRALEIAAAGGHSILMQGPPGTGKTMLASRMPSILPPLTPSESIDVASIYSVAQISRPDVSYTPFRAPHHTASSVALVGGGSRPIPGEISLAHRGILFLDELPEFPNKVLEVLRQPLESGEIWISRASLKTVFPASFQLIAAMNPCPCGYAGEPKCQCTPDRINRYRSRVSGPLLDRIDMQIRLDRPKSQFLLNTGPEETSIAIKKRVTQARLLQQQRQGCTNAQLTPNAADALLKQNPNLAVIAEQATEHMQLSARALHRSIRVAQSIADLDQTAIDTEHLTESLGYRQRLQY